MYIENIWLDQKSNLEPLQPLSGLYHWATQTNIHGPNSPNFCICIYIYICIYSLIVTQVHFKIHQFKIQLLTKVVYRCIAKVTVIKFYKKYAISSHASSKELTVRPLWTLGMHTASKHQHQSDIHRQFITLSTHILKIITHHRCL